MKARDEVPVATIVAEIVELQKLRRFAIKLQSRCDRSLEAFLARRAGYTSDMSEKDRKALFTKISTLRKQVEAGKVGHSSHGSQDEGAHPDAGEEGRSAIGGHDMVALLSPLTVRLIRDNAVARKPWDDMRDEAEAKMEALVPGLPAYEFVKTVKGFGDLGFAVIIGETGDLSNYATKERVWKRLGLAVIAGERQRKKAGAEDAKAHGYNPARRAEVWAFCDSMFRHQWAGDKDEDGGNPVKTGKPIAVPAHPAGPYGEVYLRAKLHATPRIEATADLPQIKRDGKLVDHPDKWTPKRVDNHARRVMSKALLEQIWKAWRQRAIAPVDAMADMPAAAVSLAAD